MYAPLSQAFGFESFVRQPNRSGERHERVPISEFGIVNLYLGPRFDAFDGQAMPALFEATKPQQKDQEYVQLSS